MIIAFSASAECRLRDQPSFSGFQSSELPVLHVDASSYRETEEMILSGRRKGFKIHVHHFNPWSFNDFKRLLRLKPDFLTLQEENFPEFPLLFETARSSGLDVGLALSVEKSLALNALPAERPHHLMLMTTIPGYSGKCMHPDTFKAMRRLRRLFPDLALWVDGGVNADNAPVFRLYGVRLAVSGSFLAQSADPRMALHQLRREETGPQILVADVMWLPDELPLFPVTSDVSPLDLFVRVESGRMGFALLTDSQNRLTGLATGADLRKGVILCRGEIRKAPLNMFFNPKPVTLNPENQLALMWEINERAPFPYLYFPVVDDVGHLCGAVILNHLIRYHA